MSESKSESGFKVQPFRMFPDLDFYVELGPHRAAMAALRNGLAGGESILALTGAAGLGKTTVLRRFLSEVDSRRYVVAEMVRPGLDADDLPHLIAKGFGVDVNADADASHALLRFVERLGQNQRRALLAIDEAQDLSADALRQLWQLVSVRVGALHPMQVVLVGHHLPAAVRTLHELGEPVVVTTEARLRPLVQTETRDYVMQRLARAGWTGRPVMLEDAIDRIHALSLGTPRRINLLANRVLHEAGLQDSIEVNATFVQAVEDLRNLEMGNLGQVHTAAESEHTDGPKDRAGTPSVQDEVAVVSHTELPPPPEPQPARPELPHGLPAIAVEKARSGSIRQLVAAIASGLLLIGAEGWWHQRAAEPVIEAPLAPPDTGLQRMPVPSAAAPTATVAADQPKASSPRAQPDTMSAASNAVAQPVPSARAVQPAPAARLRRETAAAPARPRAVQAATDSELSLPRSRRADAAMARAADPGAMRVAEPAPAPLPAAQCNAAAQSLGLCARAPGAAQLREPAAVPPCDASRAALGLCMPR